MDYTPNPIAPAMAPTKAASSGAAAGSSIMDDLSMKELIKDRGLTNEFNLFMAQLSRIEGSQNNPFAKASVRAEMLEMAAKSNELRNNKEMWKRAYATAEKSGGLSEVAVGNRGQIYIKDNKGSIQEMSISDYKQLKGAYTALSVAELLSERNNNPNLVGANKIFEVADNSIGIVQISTYVQEVIKSLGTETFRIDQYISKEDAKKELERIGIEGKTPTQSELKGISLLRAARDNPTEYSKVMESTTTQRNHLDRAINYIWSTLDINKQRKLQAQAALNGQNALQLIWDIATIHTSESYHSSVVPIKDTVTTGSGKSSGSESMGKDSMNQVQTMLSGTFATGENNFSFNDPEIGAKFQSMLLGSMALTSVDGDPISPTTLRHIMKDNKWEQIGQINGIYFGRKHVKPHQLDQIMLDGSVEIGHVLLPVNHDGSPDHDSLEAYQRVMEEYRDRKDTMTRGEVERLFGNEGFNVNIDENKEISVTAGGDNVAPFLITWGFTNTSVRDLVVDNEDPSNGGATKLSKSEDSAYKNIRKEAWSRAKGKKVINIEPSSIWYSERLLKAPIYIKLQDNAAIRADQTKKGSSGPRKPDYSDADVRGHSQHGSGQYLNTDGIDIMSLENEW